MIYRYFRHADDGIHWSTNVVGHTCKEICFCFICAFSRLSRLLLRPQYLLRRIRIEDNKSYNNQGAYTSHQKECMIRVLFHLSAHRFNRNHTHKNPVFTCNRSMIDIIILPFKLHGHQIILSAAGLKSPAEFLWGTVFKGQFFQAVQQIISLYPFTIDSRKHLRPIFVYHIQITLPLKCLNLQDTEQLICVIAYTDRFHLLAIDFKLLDWHKKNQPVFIFINHIINNRFVVFCQKTARHVFIS